VQILPKYGLNFFGDLAFTGIAPFLNGVVGNLGALIFGGEEDCVLLDVYVSGKVIRNPGKANVPVVNWVYGGAVSIIWDQSIELTMPSSVSTMPYNPPG
jgi:hypothetical protein